MVTALCRGSLQMQIHLYILTIIFLYSGSDIAFLVAISSGNITSLQSFNSIFNFQMFFPQHLHVHGSVYHDPVTNSVYNMASVTAVPMCPQQGSCLYQILSKHCPDLATHLLPLLMFVEGSVQKVGIGQKTRSYFS